MDFRNRVDMSEAQSATQLLSWGNMSMGQLGHGKGMGTKTPYPVAGLVLRPGGKCIMHYDHHNTAEKRTFNLLLGSSLGIEKKKAGAEKSVA